MISPRVKKKLSMEKQTDRKWSGREEATKPTEEDEFATRAGGRWLRPLDEDLINAAGASRAES